MLTEQWANNFGHTHLFAEDDYLVTPKKGYVDIMRM
jgi:hypothetical protein